ncbi:hypothetical protein [Kouleothrix sp.]|uniref:hypothetical protein n=1 Tax=Kouleothrix sp. TaxID=2779161 RepID=UPI00391A4BA4
MPTTLYRAFTLMVGPALRAGDLDPGGAAFGARQRARGGKLFKGGRHRGRRAH